MNPEIQRLRQDLDTLSQAFYQNNFSAVQDFKKYSRFNTRLKVPHYASDPTVGDIGDIVEVGGKLKICTVASLTSPTWTIVGTQT